MISGRRGEARHSPDRFGGGEAMPTLLVGAMPRKARRRRSRRASREAGTFNLGMNMEIKIRKFDQTDPFAEPKELARRAKQLQSKIKRAPRPAVPAEREELSLSMASHTIAIDSNRYATSLHVVTEGSAASTPFAPSPAVLVYPPRRLRRRLSWQQRFEIALFRLARRTGRTFRKLLKKVIRLQRRLVWRVLVRHQPARRARVR